MSDANIDPDITPVDPAAPEADENAAPGPAEGSDQSQGTPPAGATLGGERPDSSNTASKDPEQWVTGDEPITGPQASYLDTLAREAGEELPADMTKAEASENIDRLQQKTGRGA
ncbi:DUF3072 domain-containing protein [Frigoribacterium sp. CFBP 8754]|jgi:hypothetical protein|nr:DUF3072 domain-containing protein [Frigoribacterium sp. CFBP 8754]MBD8727154.1 DUF3072 domain-containing protein [Frigoribacterium sp. CFBP 13707]QNE44680.1 DUF3072 domain-containing protein [Frigoribacterium sp. NBH87]